MSQSSSSILLQGGTLLVHTLATPPAVEVLQNHDLLVVGSTIAQIGRNLAPHDSDTRIIDCARKIVSPGFIDTHHHVWQTQLKGRHTDDTLLDYTPKGNLQFFNYTPADIFWGELGGLLEAIDAGTTCIVDHAHMTKTPDHAKAGFDATLASGIRSVFCYSLVPSIARWDSESYELDQEQPVPAWFLPQLEGLCRKAEAEGDGRVRVGLGFDSFGLPRDTVVEILSRARELGAKIVTSHWRRNKIAGENYSLPDTLSEYGLLESDIILSHANGSTDDEFALLKQAGVYVSTTPATETQMAHGDMVAFREDVLGSLGADCQSNNPGSMMHNMQVALATARAQRNAAILQQGKFPREIKPKTVDAFNLATIGGARAVGMAEQLGSLTVGKQADIVVFSTDSPAIACAAACDPLAAVVRHAGPQDVEAVIVAGRVLKGRGHLVDVKLPIALSSWPGHEEIVASAMQGKLGWTQVAEQLRRSAGEIQHRADGCNTAAAMEKVLVQWGVQDSTQVLL